MNESDFTHDLHNLKFNAWMNYRKPVMQYDLQGNRLHRYDSIMDAVRATGIKHSCIRRCCSTYRGTAGGFKWLYADI